VVYPTDPLTLTTHGCADGTATYTLEFLNPPYGLLEGTMIETPVGSGTYQSQIPPLHPYYGPTHTVYSIACPNASTETISFFIYIDPSGMVKTVSGEPISGATVTLFYSKNPDGPFYQVDDDSPLMSPSNRSNPDITDADGRFGWDVMAGFYKLRVEKNGCFAPGDSTTIFVESAVLTIPPPVTDLELIMECQPSNTPPEITNIFAPAIPTHLGQSINATVEFSDPDAGDTHTFAWNWGDGTTTTAFATVPSVTTSHAYTSAGVYTITATITDAAGEADTETFQYVVIYDPNGGFVTGGGWINSPLGAYTADPSLTGKATFGFVSKYQKGANVPTGNTEFQFKVADLNFKSTSYDWLVIAGTKAQYKGTGTINGVGEYKFILTAIDSAPDKFRIKIWDKASGVVIYDNQLGETDAADPTTELGGGSIVIHK
jgi:hypothetical protein